MSYLRPRFCSLYNTKFVNLAMRLSNLCNASSQRNNRFKIAENTEKSYNNVVSHDINGAFIDDYCICSAEFASWIQCSKVLDIDVSLSDHCSILFGAMRKSSGGLGVQTTLENQAIIGPHQNAIEMAFGVELMVA